MPKISSLLKQRAAELGFAAIGFCEPQAPSHVKQFSEWLANEKCGQLTWLKKNVEVRRDPRRLLEGCRTAISLALPYPSEQSATPDGYRIARYASSPTDYHMALKSLCRELANVLTDAFPGSRSRIFVDSAPLLERSMAYDAGLGFIGKNNMLIIPDYGSYVNLAEILTTAAIDFETPERMDPGCGECDRCIQACPTQALENPFFLNVAKCLSYLSVEYRGELQDEEGKVMGKCFVGCDRCQEVCPFNTTRKAECLSLPSTDEFLKMEEQTFSEKFGRTALGRPGLGRVKRNILAIRKNTVGSSS